MDYLDQRIIFQLRMILIQHMAYLGGRTIQGSYASSVRSVQVLGLTQQDRNAVVIFAGRKKVFVKVDMCAFQQLMVER